MTTNQKMASKLMSFAMICPMYIDKNTSGIILTHTLGPTMVFTRYDECITGDGTEYAEGSWRVARGMLLRNTSDEILVDYGFHEKGQVSTNRISWSNGATWAVSLQRNYATDNGNVKVDPLNTRDGSYLVVKTSTNETIGVLYQVCENVYLNSQRGKVKGDFIGWDDGDMWWPADEPELMIFGDAYEYSYDEASPAPISDEYESGDNEMYLVSWWNEYNARKRHRRRS